MTFPSRRNLFGGTHHLVRCLQRASQTNTNGIIQEVLMKIIAFDRFKPGVTLDDLRPYLREEVSNVWRLWKAGIVRENYARADIGGVVIVFECDSVETVKRYIADFPLSKAGLIEWDYIALDAPLPLEFLFDPTVDVAQPYDRTTRT
jgi:hypothetical protein